MTTLTWSSSKLIFPKATRPLYRSSKSVDWGRLLAESCNVRRPTPKELWELISTLGATGQARHVSGGNTRARDIEMRKDMAFIHSSTLPRVP